MVYQHQTIDININEFGVCAPGSEEGSYLRLIECVSLSSKPESNEEEDLGEPDGVHASGTAHAPLIGPPQGPRHSPIVGS